MTHEAFLLKTSGSEADKDSDAKNSKDKKAAKGGKDEGEAILRYWWICEHI